MPGYVHRDIYLVLPRELCSHCLLRMGTIVCHQRATALAAAHGGSVSFTVTEPFPFLRPWHCVDV